MEKEVCGVVKKEACGVYAQQRDVTSSDSATFTFIHQSKCRDFKYNIIYM